MSSHQAVKINLLDFRSIPMRTFHITWMAFFLCFFGWFGIAPLMPLVRDELGLTKAQIGNTMIASVAITVLVRLLIGWVCDRVGPRKAYAWLLMLGAFPVMGIGCAQDYAAFLVFRLLIGAIGASFVITQYHTSVMFAPNCVGTANATTAGWGNLGGGVTQMVMPLILALFLSLGAGEFWGWRLAMVVPGVALFLMGIVYFVFTKDTPHGNEHEVERAEHIVENVQKNGSFSDAVRDRRVWALFVIYAACFGVELTINNIAALYYVDNFALTVAKAGLLAGLYGLMSIFARTLGGVFSDQIAAERGLKGRVLFLAGTLLLAGIALMFFSRMAVLPLAVVTMIIFSLFLKMAQGATYSIVPFISKRSLGAVAGIVGAGGNVGAVAFGFLFRSENLSYASALLILGGIVAASAGLAFFVRFSADDEREIRAAYEEAQAIKAGADEIELMGER